MTHINDALAREREWYSDSKRFAHVGELAVAVIAGDLVKVENLMKILFTKQKNVNII